MQEKDTYMDSTVQENINRSVDVKLNQELIPSNCDSARDSSIIKAYEAKIIALTTELSRAPKISIQPLPSVNGENNTLLRSNIRHELETRYKSEIEELRHQLMSSLQDVSRYKAERDAVLQANDQFHMEKDKEIDSREFDAKKRISALEEQITVLHNSLNETKSSSFSKSLDLQSQIDDLISKNRLLQRDLDNARKDSEESRITSNETVGYIALFKSHSYPFYPFYLF